MSTIGDKTYEPCPAQHVAFLGLGVMGYPMAAHLARAGHRVTVYNRSPAKAQAWLQDCPGHASAPTAWAMTTICAAWCSESRAPLPA